MKSLAFLARLGACVWFFISVTGNTHAKTPAEMAFIDRIGRACPVVQLWPQGRAPNEAKLHLEETHETSGNGGIRIRSVLKPSMVIISPPAGVKPTGVTLVLCPGGGYGVLGTETVVQEAGWLNAMGATAVLLKYRVPPRPEDRQLRHLPLSDAQRALGLLRSRAGEWRLDPKRIGIGGFSAGGHLAFNLACHADKRIYEHVDDHDRVSCRPDFVVLHYAAYLTSPIESLNANPNLGLENIASKDLPPVFSTITRPDKFTPGCVNTMWALRQAKVPNELHIYSEGSHGGCFDKYPLLTFVEPLARFLKDHGIIDAAAQEAGNAHIGTLIPAVRKEYNARQQRFKERKVPPINKPLAPLPASERSSGDRSIAKAFGADRPVFRLWPGDGAGPDDPLRSVEEGVTYRGDVLRVDNVTCPTMTVSRAKAPDGRAVLVFPGGGYNILAADKEGAQVATWLNSLGITAFVIKYRVPRRQGLEKHAVALQDAQRALRMVRARAQDFGVDPAKIGVLGFSAGGHLSALACLQFETQAYEPIDAFDTVSCRPDFAILIYPAYMYEKGTLDPLLSRPRINITPPMYIAIAGDDRFVEGATRFLLRAREGRVSTECHVYEKGGHGQGMLPSGYPFSEWTRSCARWLEDLQHRL